MKKICKLTAICLVFFDASLSLAVSIQDGQVHTISTSVQQLTVDYQAPDARTIIEVVSGGTLYTSDFHGKSQYLQSDGMSYYASFYDQSTACISGGGIGRYAMHDEAQLFISECGICASIDLIGQSEIILYGNDLMISTSGITKIFGYGTYTLSDFNITTSEFGLQSHLLNGQVFSAYVNLDSADAQITIIPEPATLLLLSLGGLLIRKTN